MSDSPAAAPVSASASPLATRGPSMVVRHVIGAAVGLILTPVGLILLGFGYAHYRQTVAMFVRGHATGYILLTALGGLVLLLVAASARVSALAGLVGGFLYGVVPFGWAWLSPYSYYRFSMHLPEADHYGPYLQPDALALVAGMLIGAGLAGRWTRRF